MHYICRYLFPTCYTVRRCVITSSLALDIIINTASILVSDNIIGNSSLGKVTKTFREGRCLKFGGGEIISLKSGYIVEEIGILYTQPTSYLTK